MDKKGIKISRPVTMLNKYWVVKLKVKIHESASSEDNTWLKEDSKKLTRLTALWYVTEVLAKLITYNIRVKLKQNKRQWISSLKKRMRSFVLAPKVKTCLSLPQLNYDKFFQ